MNSSMNALEGRLDTLKKKRKPPLPVYDVTFADGKKARLDALGLYLAMAQQDAGRGPPIKSAIRTKKGEISLTGTAWDELPT